MATGYTVFVVDDDATTRLLLEAMLGSKYVVQSFATAESCLARLAERIPDLFLLDVGLPGMNGYELCRAIKGLSASRGIPVVFLSGQDRSEDVLAGYEAGGQDYLVKPFDVTALSRKIENLRRIEQEKRALLQQVREIDELTTLVLANLDEHGVLIKFLRTLNQCGTHEEAIEAVLASLDALHLQAVVQVRTRTLEKTLSKAGENWPLEIAVMNHVRTLGAMVEFRTRCACNFDRITVLVTNMPAGDTELCDRIKRHIAILAESADAKLAALESLADNGKMRDQIRDVLQAATETVRSYSKKYDEARYRGSMCAARILDELVAAFADLGLSSRQEEEILEIVRDGTHRLIDTYDIAGLSQATLEGLGKKLGGILATPASSG